VLTRRDPRDDDATGGRLIPQPDGSLKLDGDSFKTEDGELLLWEANGIAVPRSKEKADRLQRRTLGLKNYYLFETPRITTASKKYDWLSQLRLVGKMTTLKNSHVGSDIFAVQ